MSIAKETPSLVILGIDAGDFRFIKHWAQEGYLPTMASIMKRGCWGRTTGTDLNIEHGVWVSLFSGIPRKHHGYYYFRQLVPGTYELQTTTGLDINAPRFWEYLRSKSQKVAIIDVPDTYPVNELKGIQLCDWAVHNPSAAPASSSPALLSEVRRVFGRQMNIDEKLRSTWPEDVKIFRHLLQRIEKKGALCRHLLSQDHFAVIVAVFGESHTGGHQFWKYRPESHHQAQAGKENELTHAIRDIYQAIDRQFGLLLEQIPENANIVIVSSVGLQDQFPTTGLIESFCRKLGYQASPKSNGLPLRPLDLARKLMPEDWRIALSRHLSRQKRERLLADQFRNNTSWRNTTAFSIPSAYASYVRVNLRGREPLGVIESGFEYEELLKRLEDDLWQLVDPDTGEKIVERVESRIEVYGNDASDTLPDLFVYWKPSTRFLRRVAHPRVELEQDEPEFFRDSDHSRYGFVAAVGPSISRRGEIGDVPVLDLAPTFLTLMGEPVPPTMTGRVIVDSIHH